MDETKEIPIATVRQKINETCDKLKELLVCKNVAYGNSALTVPPFASTTIEEAIAVRFGDKITRLKNLIKHSEASYFENLDDTIRDVAGYAILWIIARELGSEQKTN